MLIDTPTYTAQTTLFLVSTNYFVLVYYNVTLICPSSFLTFFSQTNPPIFSLGKLKY